MQSGGDYQNFCEGTGYLYIEGGFLGYHEDRGSNLFQNMRVYQTTRSHVSEGSNVL
jgi:hypothetical protein